MPQVKCSVPGCSSAYPKEKEERRKKKVKFHKISRYCTLAWIRAIKRHDLLNKPYEFLNQKFICSLHFEKCMYVEKNLKKTAIPTLNLPSDYDDSLKRPKASTSSFAKKKNSKKGKDTVDQMPNREASKVVIKYEPTEPFEMTIEKEQIGYHETAKRQRYVNLSAENSAKIVTSQTESMNDDDQDELDLIRAKHEHFNLEIHSTVPIKEENVETEYADSFIENETIKNEFKGTHVHTPSKRNLKKLLRHTKNKTNKKRNIKTQINLNKIKKKEALKRFLSGCEIYLSPKLCSIVKEQFNSKGDQFTNEYKMLCIHLFLKSPTTYKFLSQVLCLPSKNDLVKTYFPIDSKINKTVNSILSLVGNKMNPVDKECVLTFGEIKLKKSVFYDAKADRVFGLHEIDGTQSACSGCYAYTVMLRGVTSDWKLLVGFSFISLNQLNVYFYRWLTMTIRQLFHSGFNVRAVCCPALPAFKQLVSNVIDVLQNEYSFEVDGKKVYFIFDIRSMLKNVRNTLIKNTLVMKNKKASWTCVKQLYQIDKNQNKRLAPQLTESHIKLKKFNQKKLRYASEVIDTSVAVALNVYADKNYLKPFFGTIQLIHTMSKVYNILKSNGPVACSAEEKEFLEKAREFFNSIDVKIKVDMSVVTQNILFKDAISITMNSISQLGNDMQSENLDAKRTHLTQSSMQSFYDVMRKLSGHSRRVTCREYLKAFRRCFIFYALRTVEKKDTSSTDSAAFLTKYRKYVRKNKIYQTTKHKRSTNTLPMHLFTSEENKFISLCSYMLQKCVEKHSCQNLLDYVNSPVVTLDMGENRITGMRVPPDHFLIFCTNLENYLDIWYSNLVGQNIFKNLMKEVKQLYFDKPCECFPVDYLLRMFIKMRIRYNNILHNRKWEQDNCTTHTDTFNTYGFIRI